MGCPSAGAGASLDLCVQAHMHARAYVCLCAHAVPSRDLQASAEGRKCATMSTHPQTHLRVCCRQHSYCLGHCLCWYGLGLGLGELVLRVKQKMLLLVLSWDCGCGGMGCRGRRSEERGEHFPTCAPRPGRLVVAAAADDDDADAGVQVVGGAGVDEGGRGYRACCFLHVHECGILCGRWMMAVELQEQVRVPTLYATRCNYL
eukprot:1161393-Pelagomonas_calceolata.AAC.5